MKIYLASWLFEPSQGESLTKVGNKSRLLSYFHCQEFKGSEIRHYVRNGINKEKK